MLVKSKNGTDIWFVNGLSIGQRQPVRVIGDKLKSLMKGMSLDELINQIGTNFSDNITRVYNDEEIPKPKLVDKFVNFFNVDKDYFEDKELQNVIINDSHIVVAEYDTNEDAKNVMNNISNFIIDCHRKDIPIVIDFTKVKSCLK